LVLALVTVWVVALVELLVVLVETVLVLALAVDEGKVCWHIRNEDEGPTVSNFHQSWRNLHFCFHDRWQDFHS